ncbi:MAG: hypothetical protein Q8Q28_05665 [Pseudomonadota bacterium]|nr:hypothetical protein [Pseudomonadota bacterium]
MNAMLGMEDEMNLRIAMCEALVDGWNGNWSMGRVVSHAWVLLGKEPDGNVEKFTLAADAVKAKYIKYDEPAKTWIPRNMYKLNESLWGGRNRDTCVLCARKSLGFKGGGVPVSVKARELDKRSDWGTVK